MNTIAEKYLQNAFVCLTFCFIKQSFMSTLKQYQSYSLCRWQHLCPITVQCRC